MSKKTIRLLWLITGAAAVVLFAATVYLSREAEAKEDAGYSAFVAGLNSVIYLRQAPDPTSHIVTILEYGQQVFVLEIPEDQANPWARVRTDIHEGWLPAERMSAEPP
jgi:hypothetical protein